MVYGVAGILLYITLISKFYSSDIEMNKKYCKVSAQLKSNKCSESTNCSKPFDYVLYTVLEVLCARLEKKYGIPKQRDQVMCFEHLVHKCRVF